MVTNELSNTNKDNKVFKNGGKISIPERLCEYNGARFILIDKIEGKGKKPKQKGWHVDKNYAFDDPMLLGYIRGGGNYGIATGFADLHCFDADQMERLRELGIIALLPKTFTVKTGRTSSEGRHYWYRIVGMQKRLTFHDPVLRDPDHPDEYLHLGEVQSKGNYAIGPNSIHKSGNRYEVIDDSPIATLSYDELIEILKPLRLKKKDDRPKDTKYERTGKNQHTHNEVDIERIAMPRGDVVKEKGTNGIEFKGTHPFHSSKGGKNFSINPGKGVWHCWHHGSGGGWVELLAMKEGIISCDQAGKGCLSKAQYRKVMQRAEELGLIEETVVDAPIAEVFMEREIVEKIPRRIPDGDMIVLIAPPRTGKTYSVVQWLSDNGSGNYITHTHAIVEHAIKAAKEMRMTSIVWMIGMNQHGACRRHDRNCSECILRTTQASFYNDEREAAKLLKDVGILTADEVPAGMCPYHTLKRAEKHARYCFTVVNNINNIMPRSLTILDEEPVLAHFYANSIEVATIKTRMGDNASKNYIAKSKTLQFELNNILNHKKKPTLKEYAVMVQKISNAIDNGVDNGLTAGDIADAIEDELISFNPKHREVREEGDQSNGDDLSLENCVRCLGNVYRENPVCIVKKAGGYQSIYILGDERKTNYAMNWLENTERVVLIGATKALLFAKEFGGRCVEIKDFRYTDRFMVLAVDHKTGGDTRGAANAQSKKIVEIEKELWNNTEESKRMPFLILTGSKKEQERSVKQLPGTRKITVEREDGMKDMFTNGIPASFYQGSVISRGQDVDQFNLMFVNGCNFAQPFWNVADPGIAAAIIADETTNSVLRISSTLRRDSKTLKIIVMRKNDVHKIEKYLSDISVISDDAQKIASILRRLGVSGLSERDGEFARKITKTGINFETGRAKFTELRSCTDEIVDQSVTNALKEMVIKFVKSERNKHRKSVSTNAIWKEVCKGCSYDVLRATLQELYHDKALKMTKNGKSNNWSISEKKSNGSSDLKSDDF